MKRFATRTLAVILMLVMVVSLFASLVSAAPALPAKNTSSRHTVCTALSADAKAYYTGSYAYDVMSELEGGTTNCLTSQSSPLFKSLNTLMTSTHTYKCTYKGTSAGSLAYYWKNTDANEGSSTPQLFYSDAPSGSFNREHVWPKSRASFYQSNGGSDLHHLRPADSNVNSFRLNYTMGNVRAQSASPETKDYKGKIVAWRDVSMDLVEVNDNIKGDVARIFLYVYTRWEERNLFMTDPNPKQASGDTGGNNGIKVIESLDTLLQWCKEDPVDEWEMTRNDLTQKVQGNRNIFIDYPEYAWLLFGQEIPNDMVTPSGEAASQTPACKHTNTTTEHQDATCTADGYDCVICKDCGKEVSKTVITALGHKYGAYVVTTEATCIAEGVMTATCTVCGETTTQAIPKTGHSFEEVVTAPTCSSKGSTKFICKVCGYSYIGAFTDKLDHTWDEGVVTKEATCKEEGEMTATCTVCGKTTTQAIPKTGHSFEEVVTPPTCTAKGYTTYTCTVCGYSYQSDETAETGHDYEATLVEPTCTSWGYWEYTCKVCGDYYRAGEYEMAAHDYKAVITPPTCTAKGYTTYTCTVCGYSYQSDETAKTGHDFEEIVTAPTCSSKGSTKFACKVCSYSYIGAFTDKLDHTWDEGVVTKEPTATETGVKTFTCTVCQKTKTEKLPVIDDPTPEPKPTFTDVPEDQYFTESVAWAVENGITKGTSDTTFGPDEACTRGQVVTFLWRAAGCPEPTATENPFTDVKEGEYYFKAVLWAVEKGITKGTSDTTFGPDDACTRGHVVTFLYRANEEPEVEGTSVFTDVPAGQYYYNAVIWAVAKEITRGMSDTTFEPETTCSRAQIVTFLFRAK